MNKIILILMALAVIVIILLSITKLFYKIPKHETAGSYFWAVRNCILASQLGAGVVIAILSVIVGINCLVNH